MKNHIEYNLNPWLKFLLLMKLKVFGKLFY